MNFVEKYIVCEFLIGAIIHYNQSLQFIITGEQISIAF